MAEGLRRRGDGPNRDSASTAIVLLVGLLLLAGFFAGAMYAFTSGSGLDDPAPDSAVTKAHAEPVDADRDGLTEWIRLSLLRSGTGAYSPANVVVHVDVQGLPSLIAGQKAALVCTAPEARAGATHAVCANDMLNFFHPSSTAEVWDVSTDLFIPCLQPGIVGNHHVTVFAGDRLLLDDEVACDQAET